MCAYACPRSDSSVWPLLLRMHRSLHDFRDDTSAGHAQMKQLKNRVTANMALQEYNLARPLGWWASMDPEDIQVGLPSATPHAAQSTESKGGSDRSSVLAGGEEELLHELCATGTQALTWGWAQWLALVRAALVVQACGMRWVTREHVCELLLSTLLRVGQLPLARQLLYPQPMEEDPEETHTLSWHALSISSDPYSPPYSTRNRTCVHRTSLYACPLIMHTVHLLSQIHPVVLFRSPFCLRALCHPHRSASSAECREMNLAQSCLMLISEEDRLHPSVVKERALLAAAALVGYLDSPLLPLEVRTLLCFTLRHIGISTC
jgi:hypothetical protein